MSLLLTKLKNFDLFFEKLTALLVILLFAVALRIPSFFEPYWYGDEGIYLTIGHGLNQGKTLYRDIVDHKTPIIYYLAKVGTQLNFRILLTIFMLVGYSCFYFLTNKLFRHKKITLISSLSLIILTSLPTFEGLIPNGELFVLCFVLAGFLSLTKTTYWQFFLEQKKKLPSQKTTYRWLVLAGFFFGLAILTKVPAVFDVLAAFLIGWLGLIYSPHPKLVFLPQIKNFLVLGAGILLPIALSILYFIFKQAGTSYLEYGLLYNFHYTGTWIPETQSLFASVWLTLKGKVMLTAIALIVLSLLKNKITPLVQWSAGWTILALVGSSLSNRPYPHYLIQLLPPVVLLVFSLILNLKQSKKRLATLITGSLIFVWLFLALKTIGFWGYPALSYYQHFWQYANKQIDKQAYTESFNALIKDNNLATQIIGNKKLDEIYIWGNNPMLYAQTKTTPSDPFLVLFHIQDLGLIDQTVKNVLTKRPPYVVVMKDAEKPPLTLSSFLNSYYIPTQQFEHFVLWQERN